MSSENRKREQAQELLRAIGEIDDRFLMEAMKAETGASGHTASDSTVSGDAASEGSAGGNTGPVGLTGGTVNGSTGSDGLTGGGSGMEKKPRKSALRRYSTWALTAAACLTVVVVGRYVSVNTVKTESGQKTAIVEESGNIPSAVPEVAGADAVEEKEDAVQEAPAAAMEDADWEMDGEAEEAAGYTPPQGAGNSAGEAMKNAAASMSAAQADSVQSAAQADSMQSAEEADSMQSAAQADSAQEAGAAADEDIIVQRETLSAKGAEAAGAGATMYIPNPFVEVETIGEAEEKTGFTFSLPEAEKPYNTQIIRVMKDEMIEVIYLDDQDQEGYRIRKGKDMGEDISGDYNNYAAEDVLVSDEKKDDLKDKQRDDLKIQVRGDREGQWSTAVWTQEDQDGVLYSYSVCGDRKTFSSEEILCLAAEMS